MSPEPTRRSPAERLLRTETTREETAALVATALRLEEPPEAWVPAEIAPDAYADAFARVLARAEGLEAEVAAAEADAQARVDELAALPLQELAAREAAGADPALHDWAASEALREASLEAGVDDPPRAVLLARLAESAARAAAAEERVPAPEAADLLALALGQRANAGRVASDLRSADALLHRATEAAAEGTGDPLVRARLWSLAASLRSDQSRFDEALTLTRRAAGLYRRLGDPEGHGRTLLKQATLHAYRDDLPAALGTLGDARDLLVAAAGSPETLAPRLRFAVHQNRASYLERLGRLDEAFRDLDHAAAALDDLERSATDARPDPSLDRLRWHWLRGRLEAHRDHAVAEATLRDVRDGFLERGLGYEAAQVSLELAVLLARQGRVADMKALAEETAPLFAARDLHGEARTALEIYCEAARAEAAGLEMVEGLVARLRRARYRPDPA
jgi:hypothetical protein